MKEKEREREEGVTLFHASAAVLFRALAVAHSLQHCSTTEALCAVVYSDRRCALRNKRQRREKRNEETTAFFFVQSFSLTLFLPNRLDLPVRFSEKERDYQCRALHERRAWAKGT